MRQVGLFYDAEEAQVAAGFLRSHGLGAVLPDEQALSVMPEMRFGLGGYRLLVPEAERVQAERLLAGVRGRRASHGLCSACGYDALRRARRWWFPGAIWLLFGGLFPFAPARGTLRCTRCGHTQPADDDQEVPA